MSEKNEEIAKALDDYLARYGGMKPNWFDGSSLSWLTVAEDVAYLMRIFKESLKAKDRDHKTKLKKYKINKEEVLMAGAIVSKYRQKNGEIAKKIANLRSAIDRSIDFKHALDQKDAESAQLRGEVEAQKKDLELYRGKILHLKERLAFPQSKVEADQSLLIEKLREALDGMVNQFAYPGRPVKGVSSITTGGLSALEEAFDVLGYDDPQPMPHKQCNWAGCTAHSTCGVPSSKGYKWVCGKHSDKMHEGDLSGLAQEALLPQDEKREGK